jgi:hypothetical protein
MRGKALLERDLAVAVIYVSPYSAARYGSSTTAGLIADHAHGAPERAALPAVRFLVALPPVPDLSLCAKYLFFAAMAAIVGERLKDEQ